MREIQQLIDEVPRVGYDQQRRALQMAERVLRLMEQEGVSTPVDKGTIHYDAYQMARGAGDRGKARQHLRAAWGCAKLSDGPDSPLAAKYEALMR